MKQFASETDQAYRAITLTGVRERIAKIVGLWAPGLVFLIIMIGSMPAAASEKAQARLHVSATILTMIKVGVTSQPSQISIDQIHVAQGYIDIEDGTVLLITSNSPDGFMMSLSHDSTIVARVAVRLSQASAFEEREMIVIRTPAIKQVQTHVSYRLYLNSNVQAGIRPWPVALSFTPRAV